ncbi:MAG: TMF family protein [Prevotella sp.]
MKQKDGISVVGSLRADNQQLNFFINTLSASMDSIVAQEENILKTSNKDGVPAPTRVQIIDNLNVYKNMLDRHRFQITMLQDSLNNMSSASSAKIICFYKRQLDEKDHMIAQLREELNDKNVDISKLTQRVAALNSDVSNLSQKNKEQEEVMIMQDNIMNECYVMMGTKKELQKAGIISPSGLFKTKQLNVSDFNPDALNKVDFRHFTEVAINGRNPVILTQMPTGS